MSIKKEANYLTDLRDRFAGNPRRAALNVSMVVLATVFVVWIGSLLGFTEPLSSKSVPGAFVGPVVVMLLAILIRRRWPKQ